MGMSSLLRRIEQGQAGSKIEKHQVTLETLFDSQCRFAIAFQSRGRYKIEYPQSASGIVFEGKASANQLFVNRGIFVSVVDVSVQGQTLQIFDNRALNERANASDLHKQTLSSDSDEAIAAAIEKYVDSIEIDNDGLLFLVQIR